MDGDRFDRFTKGLGEERSRRDLLKLLGAATLGAAGLAGIRRGAEAAPPPRVGVCHLTGNANMPYSYIMVSPSMASSLEKRGDTVNPDFSSDADHCGSCGHSCWDEWMPDHAYAVCDQGSCTYACDDGYYDDGYGNCITDSPCQLYSFEANTCFWMENYSGNYCWVPAERSFTNCQASDSCSPGGGAYPGPGGCYKWSMSSDTITYPDANGWPDK